MYADKKIYRGEWLDDLYHGIGVLRTPSGSSYNGAWKHGVQEGQGELRFADGSLYFGDFSNNVQHGKVILIVTIIPQFSATALLWYSTHFLCSWPVRR